jgi:predicted nucleic acid-binding protein
MADYLLDTNVLLRFSDAASPAHATAVDAVAVLLSRGGRVYITAQNLIEFWAVATRPVNANGFGWDARQAEQEVGKLLNFFLFLDDTPSVFRHWLALVTAHAVSGKQVHDARLAAVMEAHGVASILTFNTSDFSRYPELTATDPAAVS